MLIVLILLCVVFYLKWILLLYYFPIIRKKSRQSYQEWLLEEKKRKENDAPVSPKRRSGIKSILKTLMSVFFYKDGAFSRYIDIQIGLIPSFFVRDFLYKHLFMMKMGKDVVFHYGAEVRNHSCLIIGEGSVIGDRAILDARHGIIIGKNVNLSSNVHVYTEQHDHRDPFFACNSLKQRAVKIDDRAWLGPNTLILPGVHIGEGAVVAGGAVVTKDVAPFSIVAGIPAKIIGNRNRDLRYEFHLRQKAFLY